MQIFISSSSINMIFLDGKNIKNICKDIYDI